MTADSFPFIVSSGPKLQDDPGIRAVIRKQAMRDAGLSRRKRGAAARVNLKALPTGPRTDVPIQAETSSDSSRESPTTTETSSDSSRSTEDTDYDEVVPRSDVVVKRRNRAGVRGQDPFSFAAISLFSNYETARSKFQIDLVDLTMLTNFHVGKSTIPILAGNRDNLALLLGYRSWYANIESGSRL